MATCDVPGSNPANNDNLHPGCWAEADDGSLIFIEGISESENRVIYSVFDLTDKNNPIEFRDAMPKNGFESHFKWKNNKTDMWTWHDKTLFPWEKIIDFFPDGQKSPSINQTLSAAKRLAESRSLLSNKVDKKDYQHKTNQVISETSNKIIDKIQRAINQLRS